MEEISRSKRVTKGVVEEEGSTKQYTQSAEFFSRLQEDVRASIKKKGPSSGDGEEGQQRRVHADSCHAEPAICHAQPPRSRVCLRRSGTAHGASCG